MLLEYYEKAQKLEKERDELKAEIERLKAEILKNKPPARLPIDDLPW